MTNDSEVKQFCPSGLSYEIGLEKGWLASNFAQFRPYSLPHKGKLGGLAKK